MEVTNCDLHFFVDTFKNPRPIEHVAKNIMSPDEIIISKIYLIREQKVMIDRDLAELYGVDTKVLKQAVRRNMDRFPEDFMFEMSSE